MKSNLKLKKGQMLIIGILFMAILLIFSTTIFSKVSRFISFGSKSVEKQQAIHAAEAGIDNALKKLSLSPSYTGEVNTQFGQTGTFTTLVSDVSQNLKTVTSTGFIPNNIAARTQQIIKVNIAKDVQTIPFTAAVVTGDGGIDMIGSAKIVGTAYSRKTGTNSIQGIDSSRIQGDAYAAGTISSPRPTVTGTKYPNQPLIPPFPEMPTFDYQYWKDQAAAGGTTVCPCNFSSGTHLGPRKLQGNLSLETQIILDGPLFVTGSITLSSSGSITLNNNFGSVGTVLIADGKISTRDNNAKFTGTNASPAGQILVVSTNPDPDEAITVEDGSQNAIFYALEGGTTIKNDSTVFALSTKKLFIQNSEVTFDNDLPTAQFSSSPGLVWKAQKGTYQFK